MDTITWIVEVKEAETVSSLLDEFLAKAALLPNEVNEENYEEVGALLEEILAVFAGMSEEEQADASIADAYAKVLSLWEEYEDVKAAILDLDGVVEVTSYEELKTAVNDAGSKPTTIVVTQSFDFTSSYLWVKQEQDITLMAAEDVVLSRGSSYTGYVLYVDGKLTLKDITLDGKNVSASTPMLYITAIVIMAKTIKTMPTIIPMAAACMSRRMPALQ